MVEARIKALLQELARHSGAKRLGIGPRHAHEGPLYESIGLGGGRELWALFDGQETSGAIPTRAELLARSCREIRTVLRETHTSSAPSLEWPDAKLGPRELVLARIQQFLAALADEARARQLFLTYRGRLLSAARPVKELDESQLPLLLRQLDRASDRAQSSSHGELCRPELFARSFYYGAALVALFDGSYAEDFVRHRMKQVSRELCHLLGLLDEGPDGPAKENPVP